jgi:two-component system response regulator AtoC
MTANELDGKVGQPANLIGESFAFKNMIEIASKIAMHDVPLLIEGEAGTGKEWLARFIHYASKRSKKDFVSIDAKSGTERLLEAEFFGYVRGSFTGAIHDKDGLLEIAQKGTLFFDFIEETSLSFQGKLNKLLKDKVSRKIGAVSEKESDVRLIAATEKDLRELVSKNKFSKDLYYQLNVIKITIPPLRERREDIVVLANHFLNDAIKREGSERKELTKASEALLVNYYWPGNIRELKNEVERSVIVSGKTKRVSPDFFSKHISGGKRLGKSSCSNAGNSLKAQKKALVSDLEKKAIGEALDKTGGNRTRAASILQISRQELIRKISAYKIKH